MNLDHSLPAALNKLNQKIDLSETEAEETVLKLASETDEAMIAEVLKAWGAKGETLAELTGATHAVLKMARPFPRPAGLIADLVGTGGDGKQTFNVSTLAALTAACAEVPVAKHGNRAASSQCGSADLLEAFGLRLELPPEKALAQLKTYSFTFLFAPYYHSGFKNVALVRKKLGLRTIFNLLGPLTNPAMPSVRLIGLFDPKWLEPVASVLPSVGCERAWVIHGGAGSDELDLHGENQILFLDGGKLRRFVLAADEVGLESSSISAIVGGTKEANVLAATRTLQGAGGPLHDAVAFNAGALLYLAGTASHVGEGVGFAKEILTKGQVWNLVEKLKNGSKQKTP